MIFFRYRRILVRFFLCSWTGTVKEIQGSVISVKKWCQTNLLPYYKLEEVTEFEVPEPHQFGERKANQIAGKIKLPEIYLAEIHDAIVIGGHNPVLVSDNIALYDDYLHPDKDQFDYSQAGDIITYESVDSTNKMHLDLIIRHGNVIDQGILLSGTYSNNYFHWIVEFLSRFWIIDQYPEYKHLPLIIDAHLHPNFLEALTMVNSDERALIPIRYGEGYRVKKLIIPSKLAFMPMNLKNGVSLSYAHDAVSPLAIAFLRQKFGVERRVLSQRQNRRIYISRRKGKYRKLLNEDEIEHLFKNYGFEVVRPELLSFQEQLDIFSSAEIVAGPTGSAFTNMIFSPSTTKIILFHTHTPYLFSLIAHIIGQDLLYVTGTDVAGTHSQGYHCNFYVDIANLEEAIKLVISDFDKTDRGSLSNTEKHQNNYIL
jgi:capsular polysaccharide biosynthesis protein